MCAGDTTATGSEGSSNAPSGLMAAVEEDFDSDEEFCWAGDDDVWDFGGHPPALGKLNAPVSLNPSCSHVAVEVIYPVQSLDHPTLLAASTTCSTIQPRLFMLSLGTCPRLLSL